MNYKIFLVLVIMFITTDLGSCTQTCYSCQNDPHKSAESQKCTLGHQVTCRNETECYAAAYTLDDGKLREIRGCDTINNPLNPGRKYCDSPDGCEIMTKRFNLKSCFGYCCNTPNCNNYTPSSATGVMAAKFGLFFMVILQIFLNF